MTEIVFSKKVPENFSHIALILPCDHSFEPKKYAEFFEKDELIILSEIIKNNVPAGDLAYFETDNGYEDVSVTKRVVVYELPKRKVAVAYIPKNADELAFQNAGGRVAAKMRDVEDLTAIFIKNKDFNVDESLAAYNFALGFELGIYSFDKYFTTKKAYEYTQLEKLTIICKSASSKGFSDYAALANAVRYARDLINEPANYLLPAVFAEDIKRLEYLGLEIDILEPEELKEIGFNLLLAVAQGSNNPARVAVIRWNGDENSDKYTLGLVGKGVCFDSGGLSLKTDGHMLGMHRDMAGAAAVVATLKAAALQKLKINIVGVVGLVENMPSGKAYRVNDIVSSLSGQTVEILNTDAEGRLVLADCLWYIQDTYQPEMLVDIATLTGATANFFGFYYAGLMGNDNFLNEELLSAGKDSGEKLWNLPLDKAYNGLIDSDIADMKNISEKGAGAITAACFLQRFVKKGTKWAHLDIAGVDEQKKNLPTYPSGATGFGVRLFDTLIKNIIEKI